MYFRIRSAAQRRRPIMFRSLVRSKFRSEVCPELLRENRLLKDELKSLNRHARSIRKELRKQKKTADDIALQMWKHKFEIWEQNQKIGRLNRNIERELQSLKVKEMALEDLIDDLMKLVESKENRCPPREENNTAEKAVDAMLKEKFGDIDNKNAVIVSEFFTSSFTVLSCYNSLCGLSVLCGLRHFFWGLTGGAAIAVLWSCYNAMHRVQMNGKRLFSIVHAQNQEPVFPLRDQPEPSTWQIIQIVWRDVLQMFVVAVLVVVYLLYLALHVHREKCSFRLIH